MTKYQNMGSLWSSKKNGKEYFYAEIHHQGRRFKHKGSPNRATVEGWLTRKREYIKQLESQKAEKYQTILSPQREVSVGKTRFDKNGLRGCIFENVRTRANGRASRTYVAEINYLRYRCRRESENREELEKWLELIAEMINGIMKTRIEKEKRLAEDVRSVMAEIKAEEDVQVGELFNSLRIQDRTCKEFFARNGLCKRETALTYVLFNPTSGLYKIGKSKDLYRRYKAYCIPELVVVQVNDSDVELEMHKAFYLKRMGGEWFDLTEGDLQEMIENYGFRRIPQQ